VSIRGRISGKTFSSRRFILTIWP